MDFSLNASTSKDNEAVLNGLIAYNRSQCEISKGIPEEELNCNIKDDNGKVIAGIVADSYGGCTYVKYLWVDNAYHGKRLGSKLLQHVIDVSIEHGSHLIWLDTFDFQARGFYEKHGFKVWGTLEGQPKGHKRFFLSKTL